MANVNGKTMVSKQWLSDGSIAMDVDDFESVMDANDFRALQIMLNEKKLVDEEENNFYKDLYKEEELNSDELYNQNVAVYNMIVDMKKYIADAKRMNKAKMIDMLNEMLNQIDNYWLWISVVDNQKNMRSDVCMKRQVVRMSDGKVFESIASAERELL